MGLCRSFVAAAANLQGGVQGTYTQQLGGLQEHLVALWINRFLAQTHGSHQYFVSVTVGTRFPNQDSTVLRRVSDIHPEQRQWGLSCYIRGQSLSLPLTLQLLPAPEQREISGVWRLPLWVS